MFNLAISQKTAAKNTRPSVFRGKRLTTKNSHLNTVRMATLTAQVTPHSKNSYVVKMYSSKHNKTIFL